MTANVAEAFDTELCGSWARTLFRLSTQKQEKYRAITRQLCSLDDKTCLDIGGDNGVISYMLRELGGTWHSVDLDESSVAAIRQLVGERVHRMAAERLPFPDRHFDVVVVVDMLEHLHDDQAFVDELGRVLKTSGYLILNVPYRRDSSLLYRLRETLGIGDEKHGHVRPGYTPGELVQLLEPAFRLSDLTTYSHAPLEILDIVMNVGYKTLQSGDREWGEDSVKGEIVTKSDYARQQTKFRLLRLLRPAFWLVQKLDGLAPSSGGFKLVGTAYPSGQEGS